MNYDCELIQDLLPLYEEGLCSGASRRAVEEHLSACEQCRRLNVPLPIPEPPEANGADRAVKKSMKKVRRRWLTSLIASVLIVPLLMMGVNQFRRSGICFTNLDDLHTARSFLAALENQDWEKAAAMHSYSGDYESILEALSWEISDWGSSFEPFELEGRAYMASTGLGGYPADLGELYGFLYNREGTAMVPAELWEQLMALEPEAFYQLGWQYWLNENLYGKISTPWGEFVVSEGRGYDTAQEYCEYFDLVPAAVYEEAKPALEAEARRIYDATHAAYDYVAEMTEAEFLAYMERSYADDLRSVEGRAAFDCTGYRGAYLGWGNDGWHMQFGVTLTWQGRTMDTTFTIGVEDGRVHLASLAYEEEADWLWELENILYPSAHPDY